MSTGATREVGVAKEVGGWGAFPTTIKTSAVATDTSLEIVGSGGDTYGVATVVGGMKIAFLEDLTEPVNAITAVVINSGDATLTISALTNNQTSGKKVVVGYFPDEALLLDSFNATLNSNRWSPQPFTGTPAKNVGRRSGRREVDGSFEFMLRPNVNNITVFRALGADSVTGVTHGTPSTTTLNGATSIGATTATLTAIGTIVVNDILQIGVDPVAECRKVTNVASNVVTFDKPLDKAHANLAAVKKVVAAGPFLHKINVLEASRPGLAFLDYRPFVGATNNALTNKAYYLPGVVIGSVKFSGASEQGIQVSLDYDCQDTFVIPKPASITIPNETPFAFQEEAVLIGGTRTYRIMECSVEVDGDNQKRFTKHGSGRAFAIQPGQQEVKGMLKFFTSDSVQEQFWTALQNETTLAFVWTTTDATTNYYVKITVPQISIDTFKDDDFSPADLLDAEVEYVGLFDAGASNTQVKIEASNGRYLNY